MKYIFYCSLTLILISLSCCKISLAPQTPRSLFSTLSLEQLSAIDISENRSQLSTMEDEVYLFIYQLRGQSIIHAWQSPLMLFTNEQDQQLLSQQLDSISPQDQLTFFLLELDNEALSPQVQNQLLEWVQAKGFPSSFNALDADNALGHDDLLGMRSFSFQKIIDQSPIIFRGLQLFDPFRYELHFKID